MLKEKPYFMKNKEWYVENKEWSVNDVPHFLIKDAKKPKGNRYILTDKAPKKAIDSYNQYYNNNENYIINKNN